MSDIWRAKNTSQSMLLVLTWCATLPHMILASFVPFGNGPLQFHFTAAVMWIFNLIYPHLDSVIPRNNGELDFP
jgi:hypothetical protein